MRIDRASSFIEAPRERVYEAFVNREAVLRWLPPAGATARLDAFDPRPGGAFAITLTFAPTSGTQRKTTDNSDAVEGRFVELDPPRSIVQQFTFVSKRPEFAGTMTMTWTLDETPGGTMLKVAASNVPPGISVEDHEAGMKSSLANLTSFVEGRLATSPSPR